jgi:hypothetical protein
LQHIASNFSLTTAFYAMPFPILFALKKVSTIQRCFVRVLLGLMTQIALISIIAGQLPQQRPTLQKPGFHQDVPVLFSGFSG